MLKSHFPYLLVYLLSSVSFVVSALELTQLAQYPSIYQSKNYVLTILEVGDNQALIKVDGVNNAFDGQIFLHNKVCHNTSCSVFVYETKEIPGKEKWWTVQKGGYDQLAFFPPGIDKKQHIWCCNKHKQAKAFDAEAFYHEYLSQQSTRKSTKKD